MGVGAAATGGFCADTPLYKRSCLAVLNHWITSPSFYNPIMPLDRPLSLRSFALIGGVLASSAESVASSAAPCDSKTFKNVKIPDVKITSIEAQELRNASMEGIPMLGPSFDALDACKVQVRLTHSGQGDDSLVTTYLPLDGKDWNGRFQARGGGGLATTTGDLPLGLAAKAGYAASATDGGHGESFFNADWALNQDGSTNWALVQNFASRSLAEMVLVGKSVTEQYFGQPAHHSYWNGCSQGGRQGYDLAQRYPGLLNGIMAAAPALQLPSLFMFMFWPQVVMQESKTFLSNCEFNWFTKKAIEQCDYLDGVLDGVIEDPERCDFDPYHTVGQTISCEGKETEITSEMADVVHKIHEGPSSPFIKKSKHASKIWHGLPAGTPLNFVANITVDSDGVRSQGPSALSTSFISYMLLNDPTLDLAQMTYADFFAVWTQANDKYGWMFNNDNANLRPFRDAGGKLLTWHGINDQLIPYTNTIQYLERVEMEMGGKKVVDEFYRLFLAPGVLHCAFGAGPVPTDPLAALVDWVENDAAPDTLEAETVNAVGERVTRSLCPYPKRNRYMGLGEGSRASSWSCTGGEEEEMEEQMKNEDSFLGGLMNKLTQKTL